MQIDNYTILRSLLHINIGDQKWHVRKIHETNGPWTLLLDLFIVLESSAFHWAHTKKASSS